MGTDEHRVQVPPTTLPMNTITPYLRARLEVVDDTLRWQTPRTVLGLVPIGAERVALPLQTITGVQARYTVHPVRLLLGLGLLVVPVAVPVVWVGLPALAVAVVLLLLAPAAQLRVVSANGRRDDLGVCIRHKLDVDLIAAALTDLLSHPPDGPDQR